MIKLINEYLFINEYFNSDFEFKNIFLSHPNYPSLLAITDTFDILGIENVAAIVENDQLGDVPNLFLCFTAKNNELALAKKKGNVISIETELNKKVSYSLEEFKNIWNNIIIAIEPNNNSKNIVHKKALYQNFAILSAVLSVISLSFILFYKINIISFIFMITSILGMIISILIIQEKLGIKNVITSKICVTFNSSCDEVINSKNSFLNKYINFTELPFLFFSTNFISLFLNWTTSIYFIGLLSLISLPILFYSLWVQKIILKKWCVLCLLTSLIIIVQSILFVLFNNWTFIETIQNGYKYLITLILITITWKYLKSLIETKLKSDVEINELKRFKRNFEIFNFLSKDITNVDDFNNLEPILIGDIESENKLTLILSPGCRHCYKAFEDGYNLSLKYPKKLSLKILFNVNIDNKDNPYGKIVHQLLAINSDKKQFIKEAISDWYINFNSKDDWIKKWGNAALTVSLNIQIRKQYKWCIENNFNYTPVKIINHKLYPNEYTIDELQYFLNEI